MISKRKIPAPHRTTVKGSTRHRTASCARADTQNKTAWNALNDTEVLQTDYVCVDRRLTRVDEEPKGPRCAAGGAAVHAGLDRDNDGGLDDDEIESTEYVCGTVWSGDLRIEAGTDLGGLADIEVVTGSVIAGFTASAVELPSLRVIGGALSLGSTRATAVTLPVLEHVSGAVAVNSTSALLELDLPALRTAEEVTLFENEKLVSLGLGALETTKFISIDHCPLSTLALASLQSSEDGLFLGHLNGAAIELPNLRSAGNLHVRNSTVASLSAPRLEFVTRSIDIARNTLSSFTLPKLQLMSELLSIVDNLTLADFAMPQGAPRLPTCRTTALLEQLLAPPTTIEVHGTDDTATCAEAM